MIEAYLGSFCRKILVDPVAEWLGKYTMPNTLTAFACLSGIAILPALFFNQILLASILLLLSGYLDTLDGAVARLHHADSTIGALFDIMSDRIVETAIIIGLFTLDPIHRGSLTLGMLGAILICVTSFLLVGIFSVNDSQKGFHYSPGFIERAEAFIFFMLMFCIPSYFAELATMFICLVLLTAFLRVYQFYAMHTDALSIK